MASTVLKPFTSFIISKYTFNVEHIHPEFLSILTFMVILQKSVIKIYLKALFCNNVSDTKLNLMIWYRL